MSSVFTLELDTTPPNVELDPPRWEGDLLVIPYVVDEPGVAEAEFNGRGMSIGYSELTLAIEQETGHVIVTTRDDVFNEKKWSLAVGIHVPVLPGYETLDELERIRREVSRLEIPSSELDRIRRDAEET